MSCTLTLMDLSRDAHQAQDGPVFSEDFSPSLIDKESFLAVFVRHATDILSNQALQHVHKTETAVRANEANTRKKQK